MLVLLEPGRRYRQRLAGHPVRPDPVQRNVHDDDPTFFSTYMLTQIDTLVLEGSDSLPSYKKVDTYQLTQSFRAAGTSGPVIFLNSIQRFGDDGGSASLQPVTFNPVEVPNRVDGAGPDPCTGRGSTRS